MENIIYSLSFIALLIGTITDLKTREVPDWISYGFIFSGIGINALFSLVYSNMSFIASSALGLLAFFAIAYIMFYAGQWGGGDSKMLMGMGAMIGVDYHAGLSSQFLPSFLINSLVVGALYGLLWSFFLAFKNKKKFWRELNAILSSKFIVKLKKSMVAVLILLLALFILVKMPHIRILALSLGLVGLTTFYLWAFVKAVEKSCMHKLVEPKKLTEGDWIVKEVYVGKQYICGPKDLGIGKRQIRKLINFYEKGKVRKILIKEGIPFVPSFLISFLVTMMLGNPLRLLM